MNSKTDSIRAALNLRRQIWPLAVLAGLALVGPLGAAEKAAAVDPKTLPAPKRLVVPKLSGTVTIDGDLTEPMWAKAAVIKPFFTADGSGREREETEVRVWYDDTALYLAWICTDADIQATFTARDSKFWEEEVAEFFITPKDLNKYYELQWNPLGGMFDAIITNQIDTNGVSKKFDGDWTYTAKGMKSAVKVKGTVQNSSDKDEYWRVEVVIPFSDFDQPTPKAGDVWRANFYRFNRQKDMAVELLSWSPPILPGFHQPSRFGFLEFGK